MEDKMSVDPPKQQLFALFCSNQPEESLDDVLLGICSSIDNCKLKIAKFKKDANLVPYCATRDGVEFYVQIWEIDSETSRKSFIYLDKNECNMTSDEDQKHTASRVPPDNPKGDERKVSVQTTNAVDITAVPWKTKKRKM